MLWRISLIWETAKPAFSTNQSLFACLRLEKPRGHCWGWNGKGFQIQVNGSCSRPSSPWKSVRCLNRDQGSSLQTSYFWSSRPWCVNWWHFSCKEQMVLASDPGQLFCISVKNRSSASCSSFGSVEVNSQSDVHNIAMCSSSREKSGVPFRLLNVLNCSFSRVFAQLSS